MTIDRADPVVVDLEKELDGTRAVLERIPDGELGFRPHPRSWTLGELGTHVANLVFWQKATLEQDGFDLGERPSGLEPPGTAREILERFDRNRRDLDAVLASMEREELDRPWTLLMGGEEVFTRPKHEVLRTFGVSHMIHHRGQLTVYLRLVGVPVPGLYGPSADEAGGGS